MKYTLISKTGKVADLQVTLEEALPALRARYGDNGRAIIRELLDLVAQQTGSGTVHTVDAQKWWKLGKLLEPCEDCLTLERTCPRCLNTDP